MFHDERNRSQSMKAFIDYEWLQVILGCLGKLSQDGLFTNTEGLTMPKALRQKSWQISPNFSHQTISKGYY